jgi:hypothetical protein
MNQNDECKAGFRLHQAKVAAYQAFKDKLLPECKGNKEILVLEFDYAQNLPLPKLTVTSQFYKRLMWMFIFNIHCHNDSRSSFYWFLEHESKKGANTVCSFLYDFLKIEMSNPEIKKVVLLSDACGGQNKNYAVVKFCSWMSRKFNKEFSHVFPVRGHSYNQCDRNFGLYGKLKKRVENIPTAHQYVSILETCREKPFPFEVINGGNLVCDWTKELNPMFHNVPKARGLKFGIQKYVKMTFRPNGAVRVSQNYADIGVLEFDAWKNIRLELPEVVPVPVCQVAMKPAKVQDIRSLMRFLEQRHRDWYESIFLQISENAAERSGTSDSEVDDDDL